MAFDAGFLKTLEALNLLARRTLTGDDRADRLTPRKGASLEFADYRRYAPGDEIRYIDWNVYARHGNLFVKEFTAEENIHVSVLLDTSRSMEFGGKFQAAKEVAAALGYIGLVNYNRVSVSAIADGVVDDTGGLRGRTRVAQLIDFLIKTQPQGASNLAEACRRFALTHRQKGVCVILSDFFDKGGYEAGLRYVSGGKYDLFAVQILSPQEIEPDLQGDLKLRDVEDDDMAEVSITQPLMKQYKANLNAYCLAVKEYVTRRGGTYLFASTAVPFDTLVLKYLRERGLLG